MSKEFSQEIFEPVSILSIYLKDSNVTITDRHGGTINFSVQHTPEVLGTLQDIEKSISEEC
jgi:hypothetical protein